MNYRTEKLNPIKGNILDIACIHDISTTTKNITCLFNELPDLSNFHQIEYIITGINDNIKIPSSTNRLNIYYFSSPIIYEVPTHIKTLELQNSYLLSWVKILSSLEKLIIYDKVSIFTLIRDVPDTIESLSFKHEFMDKIEYLNHFTQLKSFTLFNTPQCLDLSNLNLLNIQEIQLYDSRSIYIKGTIKVNKLYIESLNINIIAKLNCKIVELCGRINEHSEIDLNNITEEFSCENYNIRLTNPQAFLKLMASNILK